MVGAINRKDRKGGRGGGGRGECLDIPHETKDREREEILICKADVGELKRKIRM